MNSKFQQPRVRQQNQSFLVLNNIAKDSNFGFLLRTANAFGAVPIVVGRKRYSRGGAAAGTSRTPVFHFLTLDEAVDFVKKHDARILGIEIMPQARPVHQQPFVGPTAFVVGNEGEGLNDRQKAICDEFVYIPQYGNAVSLNINLATGIVLHHFALWANYAESPREGEKFFLPPEEVVKQS
ncbi:MAG: TrmH family RNA methyltransferase [Planctomycetota bacterium]|nr:TrmH family RNA methyltransferase [Planctomycetota bacterium]